MEQIENSKTKTCNRGNIRGDQHMTTFLEETHTTYSKQALEIEFLMTFDSKWFCPANRQELGVQPRRTVNLGNIKLLIIT